MGVQESAEKFQHIIGENYEIRGIEKDKKNSFTSSMSLLPQGGTAQCQERAPKSVISPKGESESTVNDANFPSHARWCPTGPLLSQPTKSMEVMSTVEELEKTGSIATRTQNSSKASGLTVL